MKKVFWVVVLSGLFWVGYYSYGIINAAPKSSETIQENKKTFMVQTSQREKALEGTEIGDTAPDFELVSTNEEKVKLSDYRGKKVMLNFWLHGVRRAEKKYQICKTSMMKKKSLFLRLT